MKDDTVEAKLAAALLTIEALKDRVEAPQLVLGADRFAMFRAVANLQDTVDARVGALGDTEAHYQALYHQSPDAILTVDGDCGILGCNRMAEEIFGASMAELKGTSLAHQLDSASGAALTGLLWTDFSGVGDSDVRLVDGRLLSFSVARMTDGNTLVVFRDTTQGHQLEQELVRARRTASIGRMAAGLAHELNNPLAVLQGRLELLATHPDVAPDKLARQLEVMQDHARRIAGIVKNLQVFAMPQALQRADIEVRPMLEQGVASGGRRLVRVGVELDIEPPDLRAHVDAGLVAQMLANLLRHAADASPTGRPVRLVARQEGDDLRLTLIHEGRPLPDEILAELRSPYGAEGRQVDPGLSLSLALSWAIAQDHGGWRPAENREAGGATFHIGLPPRLVGRAPAPAGGPGHRIMVVDDDKLLCETLTWMLIEGGNDITAVHSAEDALVRLGRQSFDAVITDINLPGMDGESLVDAIEARDPGLAKRTVLVSGLLHTPKRKNPYLQKPFTQGQLLAVLDSLIRD